MPLRSKEGNPFPFLFKKLRILDIYCLIWAVPPLQVPPAQGCYPESEGIFQAPSSLWEPGSVMNKLIFANLLHRPLRSLISVFAVAIEVVMILSIVAIFMGMLNDQKQRTNGIGAELVVSPRSEEHTSE